MSANRKTDKLWNSRTLEYYSAVKRNYGYMQQMNLKVTMLSETNWPQRDTYYLIPFVQLLQNTESSNQVALARAEGWGESDAGGRERGSGSRLPQHS